LGLYGIEDSPEHGSATSVDEDICDTIQTANELELSNNRNQDTVWNIHTQDFHISLTPVELMLEVAAGQKKNYRKLLRV
jgi:hypothetical protein